MRLIDVDTLEWFRVTLSNGETCILIRKSHINELPTVDAEPVRHAKWRTHDVDSKDGTWLARYYTCTSCGRITGINEPYCHCGAKMDGGTGNGK